MVPQTVVAFSQPGVFRLRVRLRQTARNLARFLAKRCGETLTKLEGRRRGDGVRRAGHRDTGSGPPSAASSAKMLMR